MMAGIWGLLSALPKILDILGAVFDKIGALWDAWQTKRKAEKMSNAVDQASAADPVTGAPSGDTSAIEDQLRHPRGH